MGSSPLARGLRSSRISRPGFLGIIPARAGFTSRGCRRRRRRADHPRSRGVYPLRPRTSDQERGSSPLARGLRVGGLGQGGPERIIPARAGFTPARASRVSYVWDHPRSRGVYIIPAAAEHDAPGSSPLARGLPDPAVLAAQVLRIIPARAGFTGRRGSRCGAPRDHPRSRGVYTTITTDEEDDMGSSPLARGLRFISGSLRLGFGIIPARAGFTTGGVENLDAENGSSPLARGLQDIWHAAHKLPRIIPARAGFTMSKPTAAVTSTDHPRSRGVYASEPCQTSRSRGSSPLARGLPPRGCVLHHIDWIIPARAGFTL